MVGNRGQAHAEFVHAESDQNGHGLRIAGDASAHAGEPAVLARTFDGQSDQAEQAGIQGINLRGELRMPAIHRERVLGEIVGADGEEIRFLGKDLAPSQPRREFPP